jgi:hypothetical protein
MCPFWHIAAQLRGRFCLGKVTLVTHFWPKRYNIVPFRFFVFLDSPTLVTHF